MTRPSEGLYPGHGEFAPWSPEDMRELWDDRVVESLGPFAARLSGPIEWVGEGKHSVALGRRLDGRPVVVKVMFEDNDHWMGAWMGDRRYPGIAEILAVGRWVDDPYVLGSGHGVVVQERACMYVDVLAEECPPFVPDQARRLYAVVDHLQNPDDPDQTGSDDPFAADLRAGLGALEARVRSEDGVPLVDDLHLGNVGLVVRDEEPQAVLIDLGVVGWGDPSGYD